MMRDYWFADSVDFQNLIILYVKIPSDEIGLQPVDKKVFEKMAITESEKQPSSSRKNGCAGVGNVAPSKVTEKYKRNKYYEVN